MSKLLSLLLVLGLSSASSLAQTSFTLVPSPKTPRPNNGTLQALPTDLPTINPFSTISTANDAFTIKLLARLEAEKPAQNVFTSPFSIGTVLAMLTAGASGQTQEEIRSVLG